MGADELGEYCEDEGADNSQVSCATLAVYLSLPLPHSHRFINCVSLDFSAISLLHLSPSLSLSPFHSLLTYSPSHSLPSSLLSSLPSLLTPSPPHPLPSLPSLLTPSPLTPSPHSHPSSLPPLLTPFPPHSHPSSLSPLLPPSIFLSSVYSPSLHCPHRSVSFPSNFKFSSLVFYS